MGQLGGHGWLADLTPGERKREVAQCLIEAEGKIVLAAHQLGYSRWDLYRKIVEHDLWPLVNKLRHERIERKRVRSKHGVPTE